MFIKILLESETPIYQQLRDRIIEGIASGELKPGEGLPSVRQLAAEIGINLHTVNKAYTVLKQDGFITIHRQKGVVVNQKTEMQASEGHLGSLGEELRPLIAEAFCRGIALEDIQNLCRNIYVQFQEGEAP